MQKSFVDDTFKYKKNGEIPESISPSLSVKIYYFVPLYRIISVESSNEVSVA